MCVITNKNHIVISISFIPGLGEIPENWHCYFPVDADNIPKKGDIFHA